MSSAAELKGNLVPNLFLYHSKNTHYDLLVKDGSRLDEMGLIGKATKEVTVDDWINVEHKSLKPRKNVVDDEKLLKEDETKKQKQALKHMLKASRMLLVSLNVPSALMNWNHKVYLMLT